MIWRPGCLVILCTCVCSVLSDGKSQKGRSPLSNAIIMLRVAIQAKVQHIANVLQQAG